MILALLHLSDIHFRSGKHNKIADRAPQVAAALQSTDLLIDRCIVVASGDIAYSGKTAEYDVARSFFRKLGSELENRYGSSPIVPVPGNHDCDFELDSDLRQVAINSVGSMIDSLDAQGKVVQELLSVQKGFFSFCSLVTKSLSETPWLVRSEFFEMDGRKIGVHQFNTSFMSELREQQGSLVFPVEAAVQSLKMTEDMDIVLSVFHHPYGWLESRNSLKFKRFVESVSDIVLTGHEHVESAYTKDVITGERIEYIEGAVLQSEEDPDSGFNVVLCDLDKKVQKIAQFRWAEDKYSAVLIRDWRAFLRNEAFRRSFHNSENFTKYLDEIGTGFTHPRRADLRLTDLFVYPDLRQISLDIELRRPETPVLVHSKEVFEFILSKPYVLLLGSEHAGKSALARKLYRDFQRHGLVPLLIRGRELKTQTAEGFLRVIGDAFTAQYNAASLEAFHQLPADKKVILFDDWHHLKLGRKHRKALVDAAKRIFGRIVVFAGDIFRIEEIARGKEETNPFPGFQRCDIREFNHVLRGRLIENWLTLDRGAGTEDPSVAHEISQTERTVKTLLGKRLLPSYPFTILTVLQAYETTKDTSLPTGSYGYLYEFLITRAIATVSRDLSSLDMKYVMIARLAYYLFEKEQKRFTKADMERVVDDYYQEYDIRVNAETLLQELEVAGLLFHSGGNHGFRYKYAYYYFVARYFRDAIRIEERRDELERKLREMADRVYYDEYLNILMFVLYLTKDAKLIAYIINQADKIYGQVEPCDFDQHLGFINRLYVETPKLILPPKSYDEAREQQRRGLDEAEDSEDTESVEVARRDIVYHDQLQDIIKINIAFKCLQLMGQILRNFPGSLERYPKLQLTKAAYQLGLRSLRALLKIAEDNLEAFREYVAAIIKEYKPLQSDQELARTADEAVIWLTRRCAFGVVKRISYSVGLEVLAETYRRVLESEGAPRSFRLVDLTVKLDHFSEFPHTELETLWSECRRNDFCQLLIRELVAYYLYLSPLDDRSRQSVCALLDLKFERTLTKG